jgi:signal transduction histidine kinase/CheY-like chemotaxis protein
MAGTTESGPEEALEKRVLEVAADIGGLGIGIEEGGFLKLLNDAAKAQLISADGTGWEGVGRCKISMETLPELFQDPEAFQSWREGVLGRLPDPPEPGRFKTKTGRDLEIGFFAAEVGENGVFGWAIKDRTLLSRTEEELQKAMLSEASAREAKTHLLAMMSHEVRTPMNAILGMTELLLHTSLSREQWNLLDTARTAGDSLIGILDNVLDISKVERGTLPLARRIFSLSDLVEGLAEELSPTATEAGLDISCVVDASIPAIVEGDPDKLRQVLSNLLGNAIKFTRKGWVAISAELAGEGDDGPRIRFTIEDTGPGLKPSAVGRIFEPFYQGNTPEHSDRRGVGLGLSIVRSFVDLMGGTVEVRGGQETGARFDVIIPLFLSESVFPKRRASDLEYPGFHGILLSPADRVRTAGQEVLTSLGVSHGVGKHLEGLDGLLRDSPREKTTLVFLDQRFGEQEVDWVKHHLQLRSSDLDLGLVLLVPPGHENGVGGEGAVRSFHLPRPLTRRGVAGILRESQGIESATAPEDAEFESAFGDLKGLRVLLVEDRDENRHYLSQVLHSAGIQVDTGSDGEIGLIQFKTGMYDLVLTDLDMPGLDGFRLLEEIRRTETEEGRQPTPVVAITAHTDSATSERCFKAGMDAFVTKPVSRTELLEVVADLARVDPLILVVEDDANSRDFTCQILRNNGYRAEGVETGEEAVRRIVRNGVAAVLLDMTLPDIPGLEVVTRIKALPKGVGIPVIGVTGHAGADQAKLCQEAGCAGFVEKPVKWSSLLETLEALMGRSDSEAPIFTPLVESLSRLDEPEEERVGRKDPDQEADRRASA